MDYLDMHTDEYNYEPEQPCRGRPTRFEEDRIPNISVMDRKSIRKWLILKHLTDEELDDVEFAIVYGTERHRKEGLSALFVTKGNYEVYGTGYNNMIQFSDRIVPFERVQQGEDQQSEYLGSHVKVDELCGLGIRKIVVGDRFGAALSVRNELYVWGELDMTVKDTTLVVMFELYVPGKKCAKCGQAEYTQYLPLPTISWCKTCDWCPSYTASNPPTPGIEVIKLIRSSKVLFPCLRCGQKCSYLPISNHLMNYCTNCKLYREVSWRDMPSQKMLAPRRVYLPPEVQITDIHSGRGFLVMQTVSGRLLIWGAIDENHYKGYVDNPDNIVIKSLSCGASHVAALSNCGKVYTFGQGKYGQLGYGWTENMGLITMRKVQMPGKVVKLCSRRNGTLCLMEDNTISIFGKYIEIETKRNQTRRNPATHPTGSYSRNILKLNGRFTDIACSHLTNFIVAKSAPLVFTWGRHVRKERLVLGEYRECSTECSDAIAGFPTSFTVSQAPNRDHLQVASPTAELYGKSLISDMTLKLSDGPFPVHTFVLYTNSVYFKQFFSETDEIPKILDLTVFNPKAYRALLRYFYQVPIPESDLTCDDLFDLHAIAVAYRESYFMVDVLHRLKKAITAVNAQSYIERARQSGLLVIVEECKKLLEHPIIPDAEGPSNELKCRWC